MTTDIKNWLTPAARDLARVRAHFDRTGISKCSVCGHDDWSINGRVAAMIVNGETDIGHKGAIMLLLTCLSCATVRLIANGQLLALEEQASAKESKP